MAGADACFAPVLSLEAAPGNSHNAARATYYVDGGITQPAPAPRFSRTAPDIRLPPAVAGMHTDEALGDWGFSSSEIAALRQAGAVGLSDDD